MEIIWNGLKDLLGISKDEPLITGNEEFDKEFDEDDDG